MTEERNNFFSNYIISSYTKYLDYSFSKLISDHNHIELEITKSVSDIVVYYFNFCNYKYNGQRFFNNNNSNNFIFISDFITSSRLFHLSFQDDGNSENLTYESNIDHFGAIRSILFTFPNYLLPLIPEISTIITKYVVTNYNCLENNFLDKCEHMADNVCQRINKILVQHLKSIDKEYLMDSTNFLYGF